jgi:hypothetical protein
MLVLTRLKNVDKMKILIRESQYVILIENLSRFEKEKILIEKLLSHINLPGICGFDFFPNFDYTAVDSVYVAISEEWLKDNNRTGMEFVNETIRRVESILKKFFSFTHIAVNCYGVKECK